MLERKQKGKFVFAYHTLCTTVLVINFGDMAEIPTSCGAFVLICLNTNRSLKAFFSSLWDVLPNVAIIFKHTQRSGKNDNFFLFFVFIIIDRHDFMYANDFVVVSVGILTGTRSEFKKCEQM